MGGTGFGHVEGQSMGCNSLKSSINTDVPGSVIFKYLTMYDRSKHEIIVLLQDIAAEAHDLEFPVAWSGWGHDVTRQIRSIAQKHTEQRSDHSLTASRCMRRSSITHDTLLRSSWWCLNEQWHRKCSWTTCCVRASYALNCPLSNQAFRYVPVYVNQDYNERFHNMWWRTWLNARVWVPLVHFEMSILIFSIRHVWVDAQHAMT